MEVEYEPGKFHQFTSMWDKHCAEHAACKRGMSLEEYIQDQKYQKYLEKKSEVNNKVSK
jgi:hypothetical protein